MSRNPFRDFVSYKIDPLSEIRNAGIVTNGDVYWVSSVSDSQHRDRIDALGRSVVKTGAQEALDATVTDQNDYVMVIPTNDNSDFTLGTALDVSKDRVHVVGVGHTKAKRSYSVTFRGNYGTVPDTEVLNVSGNGVEMAGIRVLGTMGTNAGGTMTNAVAYLQGQNFWARDCVFEESSGAWTAPSIVKALGTAAHDARFDDCVFVQSGTAVEAASNPALVDAGNGNKRWEFYGCTFSMLPGSVTETFFAAGTGTREYTLFEDTRFLPRGTTFAIASAIRGSVTANNPVLLHNCSALSITALGTDPNVFSAPNQSGTAGAGVHNPYMFMVGTAAKPAA